MTENPRDQGWGLWTEGCAAALPHKQRGTSHRASPGAVVLLGYRQGMGQPGGGACRCQRWGGRVPLRYLPILQHWTGSVVSQGPALQVPDVPGSPGAWIGAGYSGKQGFREITGHHGVFTLKGRHSQEMLHQPVGQTSDFDNHGLGPQDFHLSRRGFGESGDSLGKGWRDFSLLCLL